MFKRIHRVTAQLSLKGSLEISGPTSAPAGSPKAGCRGLSVVVYFSISKERKSTDSLGDLQKFLIILRAKKCFHLFRWNLLHFSLCPWPVVIDKFTDKVKSGLKTWLWIQKCTFQCAPFTIKLLCFSLWTLDSEYNNLGLQKNEAKPNVLRNLCLQLFPLAEICFFFCVESGTSFIMSSVEGKKNNLHIYVF